MKKSKIAIELGKFFFFFILLVVFVVVILRDCSEERFYKEETVKILDKFQSVEIDSLNITFINGVKEGSTISTTNPHFISELVQCYENLGYFHSGNGRLVGRKYKIQFYKSPKLIMESKIYINGISTIVEVGEKLPEETYNHYQFVSKDIEDIVDKIVRAL